MKRIITVLTICLAALLPLSGAELTPAVPAQGPNDSADSIVGEYLIPDPGNDSKVRFSKNADGTFNCQVIWLQNSIDPATGKPWTDVKNPDKSLRGRRCDQLILISGLKYDSAKKVWGGAKVYDPNRGIKANVTCCFSDDGRLQVKGTVLGISETQYWKKL